MSLDQKQLVWVCVAYIALLAALSVVFVVVKVTQARVAESQVVVASSGSSCSQLCQEYSVLTTATHVCDGTAGVLKAWNFAHTKLVGFDGDGLIYDCEQKLESEGGCICHKK